jgi:polysaccharide deacetylase 2 family uncharacterized protein YibQ
MDDHPTEKKVQEQAEADSFIMKLYRPGPLIFLFSIAFIALLSLGYFLLTKDSPPPAILTPPSVKKKTDITPRIYEEETTSNMEDKVKQADLAIIETMRAIKLKMSELDLVEVELRHLNKRIYHFQVLQIPAVADRELFLKTLHGYLSKRVPEASLLDNGSSEAIIEINELPTHRLLLESTLAITSKTEVNGPKLIIVIDDIGENHTVLKGLIKLNIPLTFAVWPNASFTRESVELISQEKHDLLVHFPMEPKGYPAVNPGDDSLFVSMTPDEIKKRVAENLGKIPEAIGVNNHMGSRFTSNKKGMKIALAEFKQHGLFFLDSLTSSKSVGRKSAKIVDIPFYERDTFLDNVKDVTAIIHQLKKSERIAHSKGFAIAIGHPYPETLSALKKWNATRDKSIKIIPLSHLSPE